MTAADLGIPGYSSLEEVDRGGFSTIYRGWQETFEREVAVKVLSGRIDETTLRRFRRECSAIGGLSGHPNVVTVYDAGTTTDGRPYIVMEYLHGGSLAERLARGERFQVAEVLRIGAVVAGAVESAHRAGILHRDLKPENILLSRLGDPKVGDFGLARIAGRAGTTSQGMAGTILHAAPEVLAGGEPTASSDVYSLASTLFTLLTGCPPFAMAGNEGLMATLARISHDPPPDLRWHGVPDEVCRVIEQGLAKGPSDRQRDVAQLGRQLQAAQAALGQPITQLAIEAATAPRRVPSPPTGPTPRGRRARRGRLRVVAAVALGVAALVLLGVTFVVRDRDVALPILYLDNFDGGQSWYEHDDENAALAYSDGRYRILVRRPHHLVLSDTSFRGGVYGEPLTGLTDVSVGIRAEPRTPGAIFGLFCRLGPDGRYYQAVVRTDGEVLLLRTEGSGVTTLARAQLPDAGARPVDLRLDCRGEETARLALFADGRQVAAAKDRSGIRSGSVGMVASTAAPPAEVLFDDFELRGRR